ncbi:hypothetical protein HAX54_051882 [Datura stramonium]|uniref:Uncharacterized protein n=1 Tax=Datura stramonium TaxID=4076 RepID=A0ABS8SZ09_DATST|nr:hypothetical protein [Datura stramonium]
MADKVMLLPNLGCGRRRGQGIPASQTIDPVTKNVVISLSRCHNGTTTDLIDAIFQQAMESLISISMNSAPINVAAYAVRDDSGPAGKGVRNKSTSDGGSRVVGRGQFRVFALTRQDVEVSNAVVTGTLQHAYLMTLFN